MTFSHLDKSGNAKFVDISLKKNTPREAKAEAFVTMSSKAFLLLEKESSQKGNVLAVAQLAGIMAGKKTHELIPLCHLIPTTSINVTFKIDCNIYHILRVYYCVMSFNDFTIFIKYMPNL